MEKYVNDALKWSDENQNASNARELFTNKTKEAEDFFSPIYANALGKKNKRKFDYLQILFLHL